MDGWPLRYDESDGFSVLMTPIWNSGQTLSRTGARASYPWLRTDSKTSPLRFCLTVLLEVAALFQATADSIPYTALTHLESDVDNPRDDDGILSSSPANARSNTPSCAYPMRLQPHPRRVATGTFEVDETLVLERHSRA